MNTNCWLIVIHSFRVTTVGSSILYTKECQVGVEQKRQREEVVTLALDIRQQFSVHQDDVAWNEWRSSNTWGTCLCRRMMTTSRWSQSVAESLNYPGSCRASLALRVLFYGCKTWVLLKTALASLEGFHIRESGGSSPPLFLFWRETQNSKTFEEWKNERRAKKREEKQADHGDGGERFRPWPFSSSPPSPPWSNNIIPFTRESVF